ncbi:hypothetical protein [Novosphingobium rosa]|uniref:hypothetical protein n=1 Tax=Novosphingobium rosa TaxID=76978 RepID=UPI000833F7C7|nr:hypothetical protein [Novosphingobium rosa]
MSITACLVRLRAEGKIDGERARRWTDEYERLAREYSKTMGRVEAAEAASRDTMDALERQALVQSRQALLQVGKQVELLKRMRGQIEGGGKVAHVATSIMEHHEGATGHPAVENTRGALYRLAWSRMGGFLGRFERDLLGRIRHGDELRELVRALRGEPTQNTSAREMAKAVGDTFEWLRQQFNLAGGDIAHLEGWGLPQSHDALAVAQAKFESWWEFHRPLLDPERMIDPMTGKPFASETALRDAGEYAWRNIASEGMEGQTPGQFRGAGKVANRRGDHRFFVYKDADAWLKYNDRFGRSDPFDAIVAHVDSMTRDIAAMQVLGPNPAQTVKWVSDMLRQNALPTMAEGKEIRLEAKATKAANVLGDMWDYYSGALTAIPPEFRGTARFFSSFRNWNVMTKLGSAAISAVMTDPTFMGMTARFNGLPVMREMGNWLKLFNPLDAGHRELAERAGLIFGEMTQRAEAIWREGRNVNVHEMTRRGADALMRASLLSPHTVAAKQSLGLSFMMDWAEHAGQRFDKLAAPKRQSLERYGITAQDWDALRAVPIFEQGGAKILRPSDLARDGGAEGLATATKFMSLIDSETRFGVPGESLRAQSAVATFGNATRIRRGTALGEVLTSMNQFKTYSVIMMMTHLQRAMYGNGGMGRVAYALALPTFLTLGGFLANGMLDVAQGKDPSPVATKLSLGRAIARGGGLGIVGDLLSAGMTDKRSTTGPVTGFLAGPTLGSIFDPAVSLVAGNLTRASEDKTTSVGSEAVRMFRGAVPGSNLWYTRLAFNRLWADHLQQWADPNYAQSWARMQQTAQQQGTQFYWAPGEAGPARAPDLANATKAPEPQP